MLITLRQLIQRHASGFKVTYYQRHYVWGQYCEGERDAVAYMTECLIEAYLRYTHQTCDDAGHSHCGSHNDYFIQGITVSGDHLVDGQQRLTYLLLLLRHLGYRGPFKMLYDNRDQAQAWLAQETYDDIAEDPDEYSQDIYYFKRTLRTINQALESVDIDRRAFAEYLLDHVTLLYIDLSGTANEIAIYKMMNGTKSKMKAADIIKADMMRLASDPTQPNSYDWELNKLRDRYANGWNRWVRWWQRDEVREYYAPLGNVGLDLLLKLCLRDIESDHNVQLSYEEFSAYISSRDIEPYHAAKHFFEKLRSVHNRIEDAFTDTTAYNRLRAILLLLPTTDLFKFLYLYFVDAAIDAEELERYYKLAFLGMNVDEIYQHKPMNERFDSFMASLSAPDVYHSETKRDVFNLLLRLNIDEDIKLGRRFDFSIWNNRSLEHIYSKSKVWHVDAAGRLYDGNDNPLPMSVHRIERDTTFMHRDKIVNLDGTQLSEHCIGNLVLLYGQNNASFGNATFEQKKMMFLTPGDSTVFQSRNLLHTVCVFAGNVWDHRSIVNNYNQMLKNLKVYYGYN